MPNGLVGLKGDMSGHEQPERVSNYRRELNLDNGIFSVSYSLDGMPFAREAFISYPHRVMVMKITLLLQYIVLHKARVVNGGNVGQGDGSLVPLPTGIIV